MRVSKGLLFVHPSMGLGIVTSLSGSSASVSFEDYPGRSYLIALNYIKTVYSIEAVRERVKSVSDIIRKDLLDDFFTSSTRAKGHDIYNRKDPIYINEVRDDYIGANVVGTNIYELFIRYDSGIISMYCSCPVNGYCKHLFALTDYIKHEKNYSVMHEDGFVEKHRVNENVEALLSSGSNTFSFDYLDFIKKEIKELTTNYGPEDIANYFINHQDISASTSLLHYRIFYIYTDIYESLKRFLDENKKYKNYSSFLSSLEKNHDNLYDSLNTRYYVSDVLSRRENGLLYYCFNEKYEEANEIVCEPSFNYNSKILIGYFLSELFDASYRTYKEHFKSIFRNDFTIVYDIYNRTDNVRLKKNLYLDFYEGFKELGISRDDIASIDVFSQFMDKKEKITSKKRVELLALIDKCIEEGNEKEVVEIVFSDWISSRHPTIDISLRQEIFNKVKDNALLLKIVTAIRGGYDYY